MEPNAIFLIIYNQIFQTVSSWGLMTCECYSNTGCSTQYFYEFWSLDVSILNQFKLKLQILASDPLWKARADTTTSAIHFV